MIKNIQIVIFALLLSQSVLAQDALFNTSVSKSRLGLNERLNIKFSINKQGGDNFRPPNFKNFRIVGGPFQATNFSYVNGKRSFEQSYSYTIQPTKKGTLTIPAATIKYEGKILQTNTIKITVTGEVKIPTDATDPTYLARQNIHLVAEISNTSPYVGESISVVYKIYVDINKVSVNNTQEIESPSFNGFWNQSIEVKRWEGKEGSFQGRAHRYAIIKKTVLIPQKSGKLTIDPMVMEVIAGVPTGRRDLFGYSITKNTRVSLTTGRRYIHVKPLPTANKPSYFSGAVGDFDFSVTADKTELSANEAAQIKIEVKGKGNLKLVELPTIETPNGLEKYEPEHKENIKTNLSGLTGSVLDQYTVVPQFRGKFKIPPVSFSYFSLKEKAYKTIVSNAIIMNAPQGALPRETNGTSIIKKRDVVGNAKDIRFISTNTKVQAKSLSKDFLGTPLFYTLLLLPLLSIPLGIFIGMKKKERDSDIIGNKRRKADRLAKKYLSEAEKQLGNKEQFYIALEKALHNYLKAQLQVETSDISKEKINNLLQERKVDVESREEFLKVLDDCDFARYAPTSHVMMKEEYEKAKIVISKIDKQL